MKYNFFLISAIFFVVTIQVKAQDPLRFQSEIDAFIKADSVDNTGKVLFVGSSSVRLWRSLEDSFPNHKVLNRGFGGSHFSDLLHYLEHLVIKYNPKKIFIYEGDNDIADGEDILNITNEASRLLERIRKNLPNTPIYIISPKPSIARWEFKNKYEALNKELVKIANSRKDVFFVDVWNPMLNKNDKPFKDIFIKDSLHLNDKGYKIWTEIIGQYLNKK